MSTNSLREQPISLSGRIQLACILAGVITLLLFFATRGSCGIIVNGTPSETRAVSEDFLLLPVIYQEKLISEGWQVKVINGQIEDIYSIKEDDVSGLTDIKKRTIYLEECSYALHELCHACFANTDTGTSFFIKYDGIEDEIKRSCFDKYYRQYDEYITESCAMYLKDKGALSGFPLTEMTAKEMLSDTSWLNS